MYIDATLSSKENVIALIAILNTNEVSPDQVTIHSPVIIDPPNAEGNNTEVTISPVPGKGFSGTAKVKYRRSDLTEVTFIPVRGFDVFRGMNAALLLPIAEMTLGIPPGNLIVHPFTSTSTTVDISAKADSLLVTGASTYALNWH